MENPSVFCKKKQSPGGEDLHVKWNQRRFVCLTSKWTAAPSSSLTVLFPWSSLWSSSDELPSDIRSVCLNHTGAGEHQVWFRCYSSRIFADFGPVVTAGTAGHMTCCRASQTRFGLHLGLTAWLFQISRTAATNHQLARHTCGRSQEETRETSTSMKTYRWKINFWWSSDWRNDEKNTGEETTSDRWAPSFLINKNTWSLY